MPEQMNPNDPMTTPTDPHPRPWRFDGGYIVDADNRAFLAQWSVNSEDTCRLIVDAVNRYEQLRDNETTEPTKEKGQ